MFYWWICQGFSSPSGFPASLRSSAQPDTQLSASQDNSCWDPVPACLWDPSTAGAAGSFCCFKSSHTPAHHTLPLLRQISACPSPLAWPGEERPLQPFHSVPALNSPLGFSLEAAALSHQRGLGHKASPSMLQHGSAWLHQPLSSAC